MANYALRMAEQLMLTDSDLFEEARPDQAEDDSGVSCHLENNAVSELAA